MARRGPRRGGDHGHVGGQQPPGLRVEAPDQGQIESRIVGNDELPARIRRDHVHVRTVMIADRELPRRIVDRARPMVRPHARPHVRGLAQGAVLAHRKDRDVAAAVVGDEHEPAGRVHADIRGSRAGRTHLAQPPDLQILGVDRIRNHGAVARAMVVVDFADRIQARLGRVERKPGRISDIVEHLHLRHGAGRLVQAKQVNAAAIRRVGADIRISMGRRRSNGHRRCGADRGRRMGRRGALGVGVSRRRGQQRCCLEKIAACESWV